MLKVLFVRVVQRAETERQNVIQSAYRPAHTYLLGTSLNQVQLFPELCFICRGHLSESRGKKKHSCFKRFQVLHTIYTDNNPLNMYFCTSPLFIQMHKKKLYSTTVCIDCINLFDTTTCVLCNLCDEKHLYVGVFSFRMLDHILSKSTTTEE